MGKVILTYDTAGEPQTKELELTVPDWAITTHSFPNDPDAWYFYSNVIMYGDNEEEGHQGRSIKSIQIVNTMKLEDTTEDTNPLLDSDNILIELRSITPQAVFRYKHSGSTQQARQQIHEYHRTIYTTLGQTEVLTTSTKNFAYYRWYKMSATNQELYPNRITTTGIGSTEATMRNGIMYFDPDKGAIVRGYQVNYKIEGDNFFAGGDETVIYCDMSNYTDFTWSGRVSNNTGQMDEPTLSIRNVFHFRHASEIANAIKEANDNKSFFENYDLEAPVGTTNGGTRLRLTTQYDIGNYWTYAGTNGTTPHKSNEFRWYAIADTTVTGAGLGTRISAGGIYSFPSSSKYLQINTANKEANKTEYYAVDVRTSGVNNTQKRIAIFRVTYRDKAVVGPILFETDTAIANPNNDIFAAKTEKKLIISKTFDQTDVAPAPLPAPFPIRDVEGQFTAYGMGVKPLAVDESNYGFTNPLHYEGSGVATDVARGRGQHLHHPTPYWSEYGFPQEIKGNLNSYGWWNGATDPVYDITYLKNKKVGTKGNMLYVDAAESPGVFAALNFNESFCAGTRLYCSAWVVNLNSGAAANLNESGGTRPNLVMVLKTTDKAGKETIVKRFYTGDIGFKNDSKWFQVGFEFVIPPELNNQDLDFRLEMQNNGLSTTGNDFAIDEINVYRTNPAISAVRTEGVFCMPDRGEMLVVDPLEMKVEVNLTQLWGTELQPKLYFRFLDARVQSFPKFQEGATGSTPMYVNNDVYTTTENGVTYSYAYGFIPKDIFTDVKIVEGLGEVKYPAAEYAETYAGMYLYTENKTDVILVFTQKIPASVLNDKTGNDDFNTGTYHVYVAETGANLLDPTCAGAGSFKIQFDATDFVMTAAGTVTEESGELAICTNNDVNVKAFATDPNTEERLFAYYDWYRGPLNNQPFISEGEKIYDTRTFTDTIKGNYIVKDHVKALLFDTIYNAPIRNKEDFTNWLSTKEGDAWLLDENYNGPDWAWGEPNYVGFNQHGGYFRHVPGQSSTTEEGDELDAITSATRIAPTDNNDTSGADKKPVDFRTLKKDLAAYRFFFPYAPDLPEADLTAFPVDYRIKDHVKAIDYRTGEYFSDAVGGTLITDAYADANSLRFTVTSYGEWELREYMTNYVGEYIDSVGKVVTPESEKVLYIKDLNDLNRLLARMRYWNHRGFVELYLDHIPESITSLASNYLTVIPTDVAFTVEDLYTEELADDDLATYIHICTTPAQIVLKAESWSPDSWMGQVKASGLPDMPYFDIEDEEYIYTVRLPEKRRISGQETRPTGQFVLPMLYFDEIRSVRVKVAEIINHRGDTVTGTMKDRVIEEAYLGLIHPTETNRLDTEVVIPITSKFNNSIEDPKATILEPGDPNTMNVRWKLTENRGAFCAFESYPMVHNGYNYFFEDPYENEVTQEGDPLPTDAIINGNDPDEARHFPVTNNNIGIEVMANDEVLRDFVNSHTNEAGEVEYHFRPGYTYEFLLEATGSVDWAGAHNCDLTTDFRLKVVPDVVIWGGKGVNPEEWNLDGNWYIPTMKGDEYTDTPSSTTFPPLPDTKVIIPTGAAAYPTLELYDHLVDSLEVAQGVKEATDYDTSKKIISMQIVQPHYEPQRYAPKDFSDIRATRFIEFDYNYVPNACDTIFFKSGAVLGRQDQLEYNAAFVDLKLNANQWYGLSAPLRDMYSGDFMFERHNPLVEMRLHHTISPQDSAVYSDWTQPFHNINQRLTAGMGYSSRVGKIKYSDAAFYSNPNQGIKDYSKYNTITNAEFHFPGSKYIYDFYEEISKALTMMEYQKIPEGGRDFGHRFIYEVTDSEGNSVIPEGDTLVEIAIDTLTVNFQLVGNPFMGHLDFEEFYRVNKALIEPQFKILSGGNQYITLQGELNANNGLDITASTAPDDAPLSWKSIPPMQSFIITIKEDANRNQPLKITRKMSVVDAAGSTLRNASLYSAPYPTLTITASCDGYSSKALVLLSEEADNSYTSHEDSRLMLIKGVKRVPKVFTSADNIFMDINRINRLPQELPIGIITDSKVKTTITLTGFLSLGESDDLYFKDAQKRLLLPINGNSFTYTFDNKEGDHTDRFSLIRSSDLTDLQTIGDSSIELYMLRNVVYISTKDRSEIKQVTIVRANGEVIHSQSDTGKSRLEIPIANHYQEVLMVKVVSETDAVSTKVLNQ
ncbi:hypothetical protein LJC35_06460 [Parabacteroides sp. OttesenSCG-928-N08]|nr:hypothetical protein [Parabacteroides sp. OttesenSCG-928-N08]